eukprot:scaffold41744_cov62-Phaeocystis_antarctica.AAC.3
MRLTKVIATLCTRIEGEEACALRSSALQYSSHRLISRTSSSARKHASASVAQARGLIVASSRRSGEASTVSTRT